MVRSAERRIAKYKAKIDGDVHKNRYDATADLANASEAIYCPNAEILEDAVKLAIDGVQVILLPYYIIFGKKVKKALEDHEALTAQAEINTFHDLWERRGLTHANLVIVEAAVKLL
jgi:predicted nucleotidyltransferase